jgi:DNA-directed RNA polymerase subunit RPC12/RpoP
MEKIPQEKSPRTKYQCNRCGERITIWSEGSILQPKTKILSCPYCGSSKPLTQILA